MNRYSFPTPIPPAGTYLVKRAKAMLGMGNSPDAADWQGAAGNRWRLPSNPLRGLPRLMVDMKEHGGDTEEKYGVFKK